MDKSALELSLRTLDVWFIIFGILVAIGVVGESVAGFLHWRRSGQLQVIQTAENLALANSVAEANRTTEALRSHNLALQNEIIAAEHALADRFIWYDDRSAIQAVLSQYPGQIVRIWMYPASSPDTFALGMTIAGLMFSAKWQVTLWDLHTASAVPGVHILYREGALNAKEAAGALVTSLTKAKLEMVSGPTAMKGDEPLTIPPAPATVAWSTSKDIPNEETIRIFIGGKHNPFR
ncbi:MAG: hypothetical protein ABSA90_18450 [Xanthobacteraceae bacterium]|jgi:hypothetical protein